MRNHLSMYLLMILLFQILVITQSAPDLNLDDELLDSEESMELIPPNVSQVACQSVFFENLGQIEDSSIYYYGRVEAGWIGFGVCKIVLWIEEFGDDGIEIFNDPLLGTPVGIKPYGHETSFFLGNDATYLSVRSYHAIVFENVKHDIRLCFSYSGTDLVFDLSTSSEIADATHQSIITFEKKLKQFCQAFPSLDSPSKLENRDVSISESVTQPDLLSFSTFYGGSSNDYCQSMTVDSFGCIYITGSTISSNLPTMNAFDSTFNKKVGGYTYQDCFVAKFNKTGNGLEYATYIGGQAGDDAGLSIAVDSSGNAYVTGYTQSYDFPTVTPIQASYDNSHDCFILKLNSTGNELLYSTYLGGGASDYPHSITVDTSGNAYVVGSCVSNDFPIVNGFMGVNSGGRDCMIFKINATGTGLVFSTYFGGTGDDYAFSVAVDDSESVYVTGLTNSENIQLMDSYDSSYNFGGDCFILKLNATGSGLIFSSYFGGSASDRGNSIAIDSSGAIYVCGSTYSSNMPVVNAYNSENNGGYDGFVFKMNSTGTGLEYSTYVGGNDTERCYGIAIDELDNCYVTGYTESTDFPVLSLNTSLFRGGMDAFVFKLNSGGDHLRFSVVIGGGSSDSASSIWLDENNSVIAAGYTASGNFPMCNSFDSTINGGNDCFIFKLGNIEPPIEEPTITATETTPTTLEPSTPPASDGQYPILFTELWITEIGLIVLALIYVTKWRR
ncbi:MAG: SBBP repeat-containing protein [Promethearchaeota archaeon]